MSLHHVLNARQAVRRWMALGAMAASLWSFAGCGHSEHGAGSTNLKMVTLGAESHSVAPAVATKKSDELDQRKSSSEATSSTKIEPVSQTSSDSTSASQPVAVQPVTNNKPAVAEETRKFAVEGPEEAIRVSFDDIDLLKVINLDPVPPDAPERMPNWLKALDGRRIRVRGFMYPPFQDSGIRGFVLARDNQICCFGRTPKEYDLVDIFLRKGITTSYIQNRSFDVVGVFRIKSEIEKYTAMYELEDALVIEK